MRLEIVAHTPDVEALIATAMLTTTSGASPSTLFHSLRGDAGRAARVVDRLEVQHGSILEHNRLCWVLEATESEALDILLSCRFFSFTKIEDSRWLVSANLRTVVEFAESRRDAFTQALVESIREVTPTIYQHLRGNER